MPDNPCSKLNLTLTGSGHFMSLFTDILSLYTPSLSLLFSIILHTLDSTSTSFLSPLPLSISPHTLSLWLHTLPLSLFLNTLLPSLCKKRTHYYLYTHSLSLYTLLPCLCTHFPSLSLSLSLSLCTLSFSL